MELIELKLARVHLFSVCHSNPDDVVLFLRIVYWRIVYWRLIVAEPRKEARHVEERKDGSGGYGESFQIEQNGFKQLKRK